MKTLLTDAYPPFTLGDDPAYPVRLALPPEQRLNRAAVFFRFILAVPASIVAGAVTTGASLLMGFIAWLITLVSGRLPASYHLAFSAVLRYWARYSGYYLMLTPAYPSGLFGDAAGPVYGTPAGEATGWPGGWLLVLTAGARRLVSTFLILYVVYVAGYLGGVIALEFTATP